jgi:hypothetical protein
MAKGRKKTQELNGRDFWAWLPMQRTAEAEGEATAAPVATHEDSWEGPTREDIHAMTTHELTVPTWDSRPVVC